eukprot:scpid92028/ scgid17188/ 
MGMAILEDVGLPSYDPTVAFDGNATLRFVLLSAYLFIGKEGEPRVGSGCDSEQTLRSHCWLGITAESNVCQFYTNVDGDPSRRWYLGLRLSDGLMDTVSVRTAEAQEDLRRFSDAQRYRSFRTNFTFQRLSRRQCKMDSGVCVGIQIGDHALNLHSNGRKNISRLHRKAASCLNPRACLTKLGPYQQIYGPGIRPSPVLITAIDIRLESRARCPGVGFTRTTCPRGQLKRTYPIGAKKVVLG